MVDGITYLDADNVGITTLGTGAGGQGGRLYRGDNQNGLYRRSPLTFMQAKATAATSNYGGGALSVYAKICETDLTGPVVSHDFHGFFSAPGASSFDAGYCVCSLAVHPSTPWCGIYVKAQAIQGSVTPLATLHCQASYNKDTFDLEPNASGDLVKTGNGFADGDFVTTTDGVFFVQTTGGGLQYFAPSDLTDFAAAAAVGGTQTDFLAGATNFEGFARHDHLSPGIIVVPSDNGAQKLYNLNNASKTVGGTGLVGVTMAEVNPVPLNDDGTRYAGIVGTVVRYHGPEGSFTFDTTTAPFPLSSGDTSGETIPLFDYGQIVGTDSATVFLAIGIVITRTPDPATANRYIAYALTVGDSGLTVSAGPTEVAVEIIPDII